MSLESVLSARLGAAFAAVAGEPVDPVLRRSQRADFQADGALRLARTLKKPPRDVALAVLGHDPLEDLCSDVTVAGPGFVNLTLREDVLSTMVAEMAGGERFGLDAVEAQTVVVDYSAPNAAKEMHVGHLRSTIIGDAIARLLEWLGHRVIRQNHLGDWGTPFGMLIEHLVDTGAGADSSVGELSDFYRAARRKFDADEEFRERSRRRVVALQSGDAATRELWHVVVARSLGYFAEIYDRLDVTLKHSDVAGESLYQDQLGPVAAELERLGLLRESDGAQCVFPAGFTNRDGDPLPLIVRKADGGYGYDTTDLAAIRHRILDLKATRLLYVVGTPQRQHFQMIFQAAREAGWLTDGVRAEHVGFGSVLGMDGKMLRTRAGENVTLATLLDEAVARAAAKVRELGADIDVDAVAPAVGIGAVKYADLAADRMRDYTFDYDRMLAFDGNTGPYLQYAHARTRSILRRAEAEPGAVTVAGPAERELALALLGLPTVVTEVATSLEPHRLCAYLYGLAGAFTAFYERCPVLRAEPEVRASRLALCALTARVLASGLGLLGIAAPERM
jgi:arginyl-tRNA synthetase